jgi:AcrR family transcriptional regulator
VLRTRQRLLAAALELFCRHGIDATSVEAVTEEADLGKGTFYRHFSTKQALLVALVEQAIAQLIKSIKAAAAGQNLADALANILGAHATHFTTHKQAFALLFQSGVMLRLEGDANDPIEAQYNRYLQALEEYLAPFMTARGDARALRRLACAVGGFFSGFFAFAMIGRPRHEFDSTYLTVRTAFVNALRGFLQDAHDSTDAISSITPPAVKEEHHNAQSAVVGQRV